MGKYIERQLEGYSVKQLKKLVEGFERGAVRAMEKSDGLVAMNCEGQRRKINGEIRRRGSVAAAKRAETARTSKTCRADKTRTRAAAKARPAKGLPEPVGIELLAKLEKEGRIIKASALLKQIENQNG
ncbi:MAG: hypothetical protein LBL46_00575 [Rickettsiales bacterium]|nr:hypothetical protein [Rickettsiales bacterium]